jgi:hypothetical protein
MASQSNVIFVTSWLAVRALETGRHFLNPQPLPPG